VEHRVQGVLLHVDERVLRYSRSHDISITAWRIGPIERLAVDCMLGIDIDEWLRGHRLIEERDLLPEGGETTTFPAEIDASHHAS
jgi:hypothetical protein